MTQPSQHFRSILVGLLTILLEAAVQAPVNAASPIEKGTAPSGSGTEHVILFVLEGLGQESLKGGTMPVLSRLIKEGSMTWSASGVKPALRLPTMASLVTGMPVEKHGITWNFFEFSRGYPRYPSLFDYLDLSGGRDSAIFYMDESLYQLAKPEPYTDYQLWVMLQQWIRFSRQPKSGRKFSIECNRMSWCRKPGRIGYLPRRSAFL